MFCSHIDLSLSLSSFTFLSLSQINKACPWVKIKKKLLIQGNFGFSEIKYIFMSKTIKNMPPEKNVKTLWISENILCYADGLFVFII